MLSNVGFNLKALEPNKLANVSRNAGNGDKLLSLSDLNTCSGDWHSVRNVIDSDQEPAAAPPVMIGRHLSGAMFETRRIM
jgi:hypothetical protein